jgi:hypothetical protein
MMDKFKIDLFESEYKMSFPEYKTLTQPKCQRIVDKISKKYSLNTSTIEKELSLKQVFYEKSNGAENFKLIEILSDLKIKPMKKIFINWFGFEKIDMFNIEDVDKYFDSIWFPGPDDIDLFDETLNWILAVRHDGCISVIKYQSYS